nr:hypothetical protein GCM10025732_41310 [Glycomyces mayteni]
MAVADDGEVRGLLEGRGDVAGDDAVAEAEREDDLRERPGERHDRVGGLDGEGRPGRVGDGGRERRLGVRGDRIDAVHGGVHGGVRLGFTCAASGEGEEERGADGGRSDGPAGVWAHGVLQFCRRAAGRA